MDSTSVLPPELLHAIFDHLGFSDVIRVSHVSQHWRVLARQHPTYWRRVVLHEAEDCPLDYIAVDRAIAQLSCSSASPIEVDIVRWFPTSGTAAQPDDVLPVLVENFHRVGSLTLHVMGDECDASAAYTQLLRQVPPSTGSSLSQNQLRRLALRNVELPEDTTLFTGLLTFRYVAEADLDFRMTADRLLAMFHVLEELDLKGVELETSTIPDGIESWICHLRYLRVFARRTSHFLTLASIARIPHVCVANPTASDAASIVSHFSEGQVEVELAEWDYVKRVQPLTIVVLPTGPTRVLEFMDYVWLPDVHNLASLSTNVSRLSFPFSHWDEITGALPHLVCLKRLVLRLDTVLNTNFICELRAPNLQYLVLLRSDDFRDSVHGPLLERFLDAFNTSCKSRIHLTLDHIVLEEWSDRLFDVLENGAEVRDKCVQVRNSFVLKAMNKK
ncbi:hypothetical protein EXIGLDRAFT_760118 [Exidia glandulosa HHB12029]|uniref:F-box domain-containing protein n=1 Tax=Exidia glandulosa HHB12029 TaxID=1314781 RepID=A0A165PK09_EXIGL|nr:hypothetical protein EXIGLDRAFT_760118 [Exidia glandulosa HHB12029]